MKSILKNKFSVWNKKVLPLPYFRIEFWLLEVLVSIFKVSNYVWVIPNMMAMRGECENFRVEKFSILIIGTHDFNGPDNIIKGLVQLLNGICKWKW